MQKFLQNCIRNQRNVKRIFFKSQNLAFAWEERLLLVNAPKVPIFQKKIF